MAGKRTRCRFCGGRLGKPWIYWFDGDQDFDEWCQICQRCGREHIWANYEDPECDP